MSERDGKRVDELAAKLGRVTSDIFDLEFEKIRICAQRDAATQKCEMLNLEVAELSNLLSDVKCLEQDARMKNEELRKELDELQSKL